MKWVKWIVLLGVVLTVLTFKYYRPARILIPEINDVNCVTISICIDDLSRLTEAEDLLASAVIEMEQRLGPLKNYPKTVFCSTQACFRRFGFDEAAAVAVGRTGIIVGPRGWAPHYLKHEIIHYWQAENIGVIRALFVDDWLIEGMAYALSGDPRPQLEQPWQSYRDRFNAWYQTIDMGDLASAVDAVL